MAVIPRAIEKLVGGGALFRESRCVCYLFTFSWCDEKVSCFFHCFACMYPYVSFAGGQGVLRPVKCKCTSDRLGTMKYHLFFFRNGIK